MQKYSQNYAYRPCFIFRQSGYINECLRKDNHIYLEALILSKHKIFGKSSEHIEIEGQQSFFNEAETEYTEKTEEPVKKTVKGYTRKNPKTNFFLYYLLYSKVKVQNSFFH